MSDMLMNVAIDKIKVGKRYRKEFRNIDKLADSMSKPNGLIHPIVITSEYDLRAGQRRLMAAESLGWETIPAVVKDGDFSDPVDAEGDENECREGFAISERAEMYKDRMEEIGNRRGQRTDLNGDSNAGKSTRDIAAEELGFSGSTEARMAVAIVDSGSPELVKAVDAGAIALDAAVKATELGAKEQKAITKMAEDKGKLAAGAGVNDLLKNLIERKGVKALRDAVNAGDITLARGAKIANVSLGKQLEAVKQILEKKRAMAEKKVPASKPSKNGRSKFDERPVRVCIDKLAKILNARKNACGDCPAYRKCVAILEDLNTAVKDWQKG